MKICFVGPANNYHIKKFCEWFLKDGNEVHVISFIDAKIKGVKVHFLNAGINTVLYDKEHNKQPADFKKIAYLFTAKKVKKILEEIKPDIVNAHYATSYGTVMALSGYHPYIVSVWGADIYEFPRKGVLHKILLRYSLNNADYLFSTSKAMAVEASKYTFKKFAITPFGVDTDLFSPDKKIEDKDKFVIGTVKKLSYKYGIDILLRAVKIVHTEYPDLNLELRIAGEGDDAKTFKALAKELKIDKFTKWLGFISQADAAKEWASMDIGVVPSVSASESFGVSAVECQACGTPLIITNIPGLKEAADCNKTSLVVKPRDPYDLAKAIIMLYQNKDLRIKLENNGRDYVISHYEINKCFQNIKRFYKKVQKRG